MGASGGAHGRRDRPWMFAIEAVPVGVTLINLTEILAGFAGPWAIGPLKDYSGGTATGLYAFMPVLGAMNVFVTLRRPGNR